MVDIGVEWHGYTREQWNATGDDRPCPEGEWVLLAVASLPDGRTVTVDRSVPVSTSFEEAIEEARPVLDGVLDDLGFGESLGTRVVYDDRPGNGAGNGRG